MVVVGCFIVGIALHSVVPCYPQIWLSLLAILGLIGVILFRQPRVCCAMLMGAIVCAGVAAAQIEAFYYPPNHIGAYATDDPRLAWLELQIDHEPRILVDPFSAHPLPPKQVVTATVKRVKTWNGWVDCCGEILVQISQPHPRLAINQRVQVLGTLERPGVAMNPGQFDWAAYYREQRILASLHISQAANITILYANRLGPLDWLRERSRQLLAEGFSSDRLLDYALLRALLLGDSDPELRDVQEQFRKTGTSHHLSVSGMHVAVLGAFVYGICRLLRLRPRWSISIGMGFTILYGVITLPAPPIMRSVMLCVFFGVGLLLRRTRDPMQLLAVSIFAMLIYHPLDLYNAGFQLSFGTVLALMIFSRRFLEFMRGFVTDEFSNLNRNLSLRQRIARRIRGGLFDAFCIAILAWAVSMPLIIYHFNQINPWAIVAGIVLAPFVFTALVGGLLKVLLTMLWPSFSPTWALLAATPIAAMRHVLGWLALLPGSDFPIPAMPVWALFVIYGLFLLTLIPMPRPRLRLVVRCGPVAACAMAIVLPLHLVRSTIAPDELKLTLLALGAGQCAVIDTPAGRTVVVDAGSSSMSDLLGKCISPYLRATQHTSIDTMLLTHSDYDHISAAGAVAQAYGVREVLVDAEFREHAQTTAPAEALLKTFDALEIAPRVVLPGEHIALDHGVELEILWPPVSRGDLSSNESACVAQLRYAGRSILITGDIQEIAEKELLKWPDALRADVLIAPHHGSSETTTADFVGAVHPSMILSSNDRTLTGKQKRFEHLIGDTPLYRTNRCGAITVHISKDGGVRVETFLRRP
jgi:competence protein ComEC